VKSVRDLIGERGVFCNLYILCLFVFAQFLIYDVDMVHGCGLILKIIVNNSKLNLKSWHVSFQHFNVLCSSFCL